VLREEGTVEKHLDRSYMQYLPPRNDGWVNKYNRLVSIAWLANTGVSPCTSIIAVMEYVLKYATKFEKASPSYLDMLGKIIPYVNENRPFQSMVTKLINKLIGEREYSSQEVMHMLLDLPLCHSSRTFINVDTRLEKDQPYMYRIAEGETRRGMSLVEHYKKRPEELEDITYLQFLRRHQHRHPYKTRTRAKDRVLNFFPRYQPDDVENYGRVKLMLHHSFRDVADLLYIPAIHDEECSSYMEAYEYCNARCNHEHDGFDDPLPDPEGSVHEATQDDPDEEALNNMDAEWG
jgi:ATP-dependent DNA helicase PIF1